jgi:hypothetical protein
MKPPRSPKWLEKSTGAIPDNRRAKGANSGERQHAANGDGKDRYMIYGRSKRFSGSPRDSSGQILPEESSLRLVHAN